ncbi:hypothetical protein CI102_10970 [Trichoderma harzianum]|nr:hypothetical protein CI102_10970 [Trichoderma harzianum]
MQLTLWHGSSPSQRVLDARLRPVRNSLRRGKETACTNAGMLTLPGALPFSSLLFLLGTWYVDGQLMWRRQKPLAFQQDAAVLHQSRNDPVN